MIDGLAQTLGPAAPARLFTTTFDDFAYDIGAFIRAEPKTERGMKERATAELIFPTRPSWPRPESRPARCFRRGTTGFGQALLATIAALIGFSTLLVGGFSRFGLWRQMIAAIFLLILIKAAGKRRGGPGPGRSRSVAAGLHAQRGRAGWRACHAAPIADRPGLLRRRGAPA